MFQASEKLHAAILGNQRTFSSKIVVDGTEITSGIRSILTTSYVSEDNAFSLGGIASSKVDIVMWNPGIDIDGKEFAVYIGMNIDDSTEWVPMGMFTAKNPYNDDGLFTFTGYDRIQTKMTGQYSSQLEYPTDAKNVLAEISTMTGVQIDTSSLTSGILLENRIKSTEQDVDSDGNAVTNVEYVPPLDGYTYKDALYYIAQLYAAYAYPDRTGTVRFSKIVSGGNNLVVSKVNQNLFYYDAGENIVRTDADYVIEDNYLIIAGDSYIGSDGNMYYKNDYVIKTSRYYDDLVLNSPAFSITGIKSTFQNEEFLSGGVVNVVIENPVMTQERLDYIYNDMSGLNFIPASVSFLGDMCLEFGDIITVVKKSGETVNVPIMHITHDFDGGVLTTIQSFGTGENGTTASYSSSPTTQRIERLEEEILNVKEIVAQKARFDYVYAVDAEFRNVRADYGEFKELTADNFSAVAGEFEIIRAEQAEFQQVTAESISAVQGDFETLNANYAEFKEVTTESIVAINGEFENLSIKYATIDLANIENGTITNAMIGDAEITSAKIAEITATKITSGTLDAEIVNVVNLNASEISTGTLSVDRLLIRGTVEGLIYEINNIPGASQDNNMDTINGEVLTDRTINADKIVANSITANEINVENLFAQDITATGTITGVKIVGATGEFTGDINATSMEIKDMLSFYNASNSSEKSTAIGANGNQLVLNGYASGGEVIQVGSDTLNMGVFEATGNIISGGTIKASGNIYENGVLLSNTYAEISDLNSYLPKSGGTITGTLILSKTTDLSGLTNNSPALIIGGTSTTKHMEIDNNEIQAKATGTTVNPLYLNPDGGLVSVGSGGLEVHGSFLFDNGASNTYAYFGGSDTAGQRAVYIQDDERCGGLYLPNSNNIGVYDKTNENWLIYATSAGTVISNASDRREKHDYGIIDRTETLDILRGLNEHKFTYLTDKNNVMQYGLMAQDLRDLLLQKEIGYRPLLQINSNDGSGEIYYDLNMPEQDVRYSIDYSKLVPLLHDGWQYHDEAILNLIGYVEDLQTKVIVLTKQMEELRTA